MRPASALTRREPSRAGARALRLLVGRATASRLERYGVAVAISAAAIAAGLLLPADQLAFRVTLYIGAAAMATLRGGVAPGLTAVGLCAGAFAAGTPRGPTTWLVESDPVHRWLFFVASAALTVWGGAALRDGYRHLHVRRRRAEERAYGLRIAAELGVRALAEGNLDALLEDTLAAVRRALRCQAVTLLELEEQDDTLRLRHAIGLTGAQLGRRFGPAEAPAAFGALRERGPFVVRDWRADPGRLPPALAETGIASSLAVPIAAPGPGGRYFGVIAAHAVTPAAFGEDGATFLQTAANVVGTAAVRIRAEERALRTLAKERFLAEASRQLALSIDWQQTVSRIARLALPFLGDWCLVVVLDGGRPRSVVAESSAPLRAAAMEELLERYPIDLGAEHGVGRILRTGEAELLRDVTAEAFVLESNAEAEVRREVLRRLGVVSYVGAPLTVGGRVLGAIAFGVSDGPRRFGPEDLDVARELAQRCAAALDNAALYRAAQDATRAREQVLAVVSHDLKTPLGALLLGAQVVQRLAPEGAGGDDLRRAATTVRRTAERMQRLIHDLVDVAGIDAGGPSVVPAVHDAGAVVREVVEPLRVVAGEQGITLAMEVGEVPPVRCDRDRVAQVLANLLTNAMHVTPAGGSIRVCVWSTGEEVVFRVVDSGPGIPPDDLPHVFERWYRGKARYPGSGLGLAIARTIVGKHGGAIWAESREGVGASLSFALPASFGAGASVG